MYSHCSRRWRLWVGKDSNLRRHKSADLQSALVGRLSTYPNNRAGKVRGRGKTMQIGSQKDGSGHVSHELLEQIVRIVWAGAGLGVILDGKSRHIPQRNAGTRFVIEVHVRHFRPVRQG